MSRMLLVYVLKEKISQKSDLGDPGDLGDLGDLDLGDLGVKNLKIFLSAHWS